MCFIPHGNHKSNPVGTIRGSWDQIWPLGVVRGTPVINKSEKKYIYTDENTTEGVFTTATNEGTGQA